MLRDHNACCHSVFRAWTMRCGVLASASVLPQEVWKSTRHNAAMGAALALGSVVIASRKATDQESDRQGDGSGGVRAPLDRFADEIPRFAGAVANRFCRTCTLAPSPIRDAHSEGFSHFVTSIAAPVAPGWSGCPVGLAPTGKRRLVTAHTHRSPSYPSFARWDRA